MSFLVQFVGHYEKILLDYVDQRSDASGDCLCSYDPELIEQFVE